MGGWAWRGVGSYIYILYIVGFGWLTGVTGKFAIFFYITKFKYNLCYYLNLFAILAKGTVW